MITTVDVEDVHREEDDDELLLLHCHQDCNLLKAVAEDDDDDEDEVQELLLPVVSVVFLDDVGVNEPYLMLHLAFQKFNEPLLLFSSFFASSHNFFCFLQQLIL